MLSIDAFSVAAGREHPARGSSLLAGESVQALRKRRRAGEGIGPKCSEMRRFDIALFFISRIWHRLSFAGAGGSPKMRRMPDVCEGIAAASGLARRASRAGGSTPPG